MLSWASACSLEQTSAYLSKHKLSWSNTCFCTKTNAHICMHMGAIANKYEESMHRLHTWKLACPSVHKRNTAKCVLRDDRQSQDLSKFPHPPGALAPRVLDSSGFRSLHLYPLFSPLCLPRLPNAFAPAPPHTPAPAFTVSRWLLITGTKKADLWPARAALAT